MDIRSQFRIAVWGCALLVTAGSAHADHGAHGSARELVSVSLEGRLIDVRCHALRLASKSGAGAASECRDGAPDHPVGLQVTDGSAATLYLLATPPLMLTPHLGSTARLEGKQSPIGRNLVKPERLEVRTAQGWRPVALLPDM
jgi:hypothetical protein